MKNYHCLPLTVVLITVNYFCVAQLVPNTSLLKDSIRKISLHTKKTKKGTNNLYAEVEVSQAFKGIESGYGFFRQSHAGEKLLGVGAWGEVSIGDTSHLSLGLDVTYKKITLGFAGGVVEYEEHLDKKNRKLSYSILSFFLQAENVFAVSSYSKITGLTYKGYVHMPVWKKLDGGISFGEIWGLRAEYPLAKHIAVASIFGYSKMHGSALSLAFVAKTN